MLGRIMPAYYADNVGNFRATSGDKLLLQLIEAYEADRYKDLITAQIEAWRAQVVTLQEVLSSPELAAFDVNNWGIALEFVIPRKMGRVDAVLLIGTAIVGLGFKTETVGSSAADQIEDYCLDLLYFHEASHNRVIYPVVVASRGADLPTRKFQIFHELQPTTFVNAVQGLTQKLLSLASEHSAKPQIPISAWNSAQYRPVPTIVEAAIGMFASMQVADIAKAGCDPINLTQTVETIRRLASESAREGKKTVCFVTGVPGAGKTLAGLKIVYDSELRESAKSDAVFLTGNFPLVQVLREALTRDLARRRKKNLRVSSRDPKTSIDTVLGYKRTHTRADSAPPEKVVVFDEAQRAWDAKRTEKYLDKAVEWIGYSEPELMMAILDRQPWATLVALIGGGQEINEGEAGLAEWGRALRGKFIHWRAAVSEQALTGEYGAGAKLFEGGIPQGLEVIRCPGLHLDTPTRQFRGKTIASWAEALLKGDVTECRRIVKENSNYPIYVTRDLALAKTWLRTVARGTERYGCIASSEGERLRAEGLELPPARANGVEHWFLEKKGDVRSSFQLEVAATEFQIQGLEIDWSCVCWGGDLLRSNQNWRLQRFRGTVWQKVGQESARAYIVNTHRVLLTRARQGMVLFVPRGDDEDSTRRREPFDETALFLFQCGAKPLPM